MTLPVVEVRDLSYKYPTSSDFVLKDISFHVSQGEFLGIVGPTGAGKTTLAMCLRGLIPHNFGGTIGGEIIVAGRSIIESLPGELADSIGIVLQNAETQTIGLTVVEDLAFGLENLNLPPQEMRNRINRVAEIVQIEHLLNRETWALSGGQKQRLAIGSVLVMEPQVLILDEPTAELDPVGKAAIFEIVRRIQSERELTIIMVEHEVEALAEVADNILVLDCGQVACLGSTKDTFRDVALLHKSHERAPFAAELFADLIEQNFLKEEEFTPREDEAIAILKEHLSR